MKLELNLKSFEPKQKSSGNGAVDGEIIRNRVFNVQFVDPYSKEINKLKSLAALDLSHLIFHQESRTLKLRQRFK